MAEIERPSGLLQRSWDARLSGLPPWCQDYCVNSHTQPAPAVLLGFAHFWSLVPVSWLGLWHPSYLISCGPCSHCWAFTLAPCCDSIPVSHVRDHVHSLPQNSGLWLRNTLFMSSHVWRIGQPKTDKGNKSREGLLSQACSTLILLVNKSLLSDRNSIQISLTNNNSSTY